MKSLLLDKDGDFVINDNNFVMVEDEIELAQSLRLLYGTRKGEWFLDENAGLERENIFAKIFNEDAIRDDIIEASGQEERVSGIEDIQLSRTGRKLSIDMNIIREDESGLIIEGVELDA